MYACHWEIVPAVVKGGQWLGGWLCLSVVEESVSSSSYYKSNLITSCIRKAVSFTRFECASLCKLSDK